MNVNLNSYSAWFLHHQDKIETTVNLQKPGSKKDTGSQEDDSETENEEDIPNS